VVINAFLLAVLALRVSSLTVAGTAQAQRYVTAPPS
jgi:hypothetical protein